jgi:C-terminal processing protease CtpA/Prc
VLGVRELPHVIVVGDVTPGAFSDVAHERLPNGWTLNYPMNVMVDVRQRCWEGVGLAPDFAVVNDPAEVRAGRDRVLEIARMLLVSSQR